MIIHHSEMEVQEWINRVDFSMTRISKQYMPEEMSRSKRYEKRPS